MFATRRFGITLVTSVIAGSAALLAAQQPIDPANPATLPRMSIEDFSKAHAAARVLVVDVRNAASFRVGHIPGAINVPFREVARLVGEVRSKARGRRVVTYCSCPAEHLSAEAAAELFRLGVTDVAALVGGYTEWIAIGGKIERAKRLPRSS